MTNETRTLAPILTAANLIETLRHHLVEHSYLEYRTKHTQRKHKLCDVQSINVILTVYDAVNESNKAKTLEMFETRFEHDVNALAAFCWRFV